jgi:hypothetical protein
MTKLCYGPSFKNSRTIANISGAAVQRKGILPSSRLILSFTNMGDVVIVSTTLQNDLFHA